MQLFFHTVESERERERISYDKNNNQNDGDNDSYSYDNDDDINDRTEREKRGGRKSATSNSISNSSVQGKMLAYIKVHITYLLYISFHCSVRVSWCA